MPLVYDTTLSNGVRGAHSAWVCDSTHAFLLLIYVCLYVSGINAIVTTNTLPLQARNPFSMHMFFQRHEVRGLNSAYHLYFIQKCVIVSLFYEYERIYNL